LGRAEALKVKRLVERLGEPYSRLLGLNPSPRREKDLFRWFLASILLGAPIREQAALKTFRLLMEAGIDSPKAILEAGWNRLVEILDAGGYTRYDFKTADKLLEMAENLQASHGGSLLKLVKEASSLEELEARLKALAKGIGSTTVSIFLREAGLPAMAPPLSRFELQAALNLHLFKSPEKASPEALAEIWRKAGSPGSLAGLRAALLRLGRDYCGKKRCGSCPLGELCPSKGSPLTY